MSSFLERLRFDAFGGREKTRAVDLRGWVNGGFRECLDVVAEHVAGRDDAVVLEVGSWKGASAVMIAERLKPHLRWLVCIDTWLGSPEFYTWGLDDETRGGSLLRERGYPTVFHTFANNVLASGHADVVAPFPISSIQAAEVLAFHKIEADVVYIDASHEHDAVLADLKAFGPLIRAGGIMWGDDWSWSGVRSAVSEFAESRGLSIVNVGGDNWMMYV
jgi:hypothetical protein